MGRVLRQHEFSMLRNEVTVIGVGPRSGEGIIDGVSPERSKTILVLRRSDDVVDLEPVPRHMSRR